MIKRLRLLSRSNPLFTVFFWRGLRRLEPVSRVFGFDRGQPIDRYYIGTFLEACSNDISGQVMEIGDPGYTLKYGGAKVTKSVVLHVQPGNLGTNLVGDLTTGEGIPSSAFDCIILTQTLHVIYDIKTAIGTVQRALRTGGVVLATFPGISQISRYDMDRWGDFWRFTSLSARKLFQEIFGEGNVQVTVYGNVLSAIAFLHGLAAAELKQNELAHVDPDYEVIIGVRAVKAIQKP